jgi:type VI protein secretion system component Hcp
MDRKDRLVATGLTQGKDTIMPAKKSKTSSASKKPVKSLSKSQMRSAKGGDGTTTTGKTTFNPFTITKKIDVSSPTLFT